MSVFLGIGLSALLLTTPPAVAAGGGAKNPPRHVEMRITGPIFTLPDYTANLPGFDQCRETGLDTTSVVQRRTTLDMTALGLGILLKTPLLDFGATASPGDFVVLSVWPTKNCQLLVTGIISSGQWPLPAGSPGADLVVTIPAGTPWTFNRVGGGSAQCSGHPTLNADVLITIRRNDARTGAICDCPFDYTDANENMIADECE